MDFKEKVRLAMILSLAVLRIGNSSRFRVVNDCNRPLELTLQRVWGREGTINRELQRMLYPFSILFNTTLTLGFLISRTRRLVPPTHRYAIIAMEGRACESVCIGKESPTAFTGWYKNSSGVRCGKRTKGSQLNSPGFQPWGNASQWLRPEGTQEGGNRAEILRPFRTRSFILAAFPGLKPWAIMRWAFSPITVCLGYIAGMRWAAPVKACKSIVKKCWTSLNVADDSVVRDHLTFSPILNTSTALNILTKDQG